MATDAQITANRANAQLSSGPKTEEGKAKCSQNALRHGLTARGLIVLPGQEEAFTTLEEELRTSLQPFGIIEETIFKTILESAWNLERCRQAQGKLYSQAEDAGLDPLLDDKIGVKYDRIQKYARENRSALFNSMRQLGHIQTEMQFRHQLHPLTAEDVNDPDRFSRTPQSASPICSVQKALQAVKTCKRPEKPVVQNRAKSSQQDFFALLDRLTAPPISDRSIEDLDAELLGERKEAA